MPFSSCKDIRVQKFKEAELIGGLFFHRIEEQIQRAE
jgi:hypothetical protein